MLRLRCSRLLVWPILLQLHRRALRARLVLQKGTDRPLQPLLHHQRDLDHPRRQSLHHRQPTAQSHPRHQHHRLLHQLRTVLHQSVTHGLPPRADHPVTLQSSLTPSLRLQTIQPATLPSFLQLQSGLQATQLSSRIPGHLLQALRQPIQPFQFRPMARMALLNGIRRPPSRRTMPLPREKSLVGLLVV